MAISVTESGEISATRRCAKCGATKELSEFYRRGPHGLQPHCKTCQSYKTRKPSRPRTYDEQRNSSLKYSYGITTAEYNVMFDEQFGCCRICRTHQSELRQPLYVDHCHATDEVRGLLCRQCNSTLGYMKENPAFLRAAAEYLEEFGK